MTAQYGRWALGALLLGAAVVLIIASPLPVPMAPGSENAGLVSRAVHILLLAALLCLFRVLVGPTGADRVVAIDIFGILIVGVCAVLAVSTGRSWYVDIGIAWALQSFIGTLALSKYLEGRAFDD